MNLKKERSIILTLGALLASSVGLTFSYRPVWWIRLTVSCDIAISFSESGDTEGGGRAGEVEMVMTVI